MTFHHGDDPDRFLGLKLLIVEEKTCNQLWLSLWSLLDEVDRRIQSFLEVNAISSFLICTIICNSLIDVWVLVDCRKDYDPYC